MPYISLNGNMVTYLSPEGVLGIRLPEDAREAFLQKYQTSLFKSYGTILKEYVTVPDQLLTNTTELKQYFDMSISYAKILKPKPIKKKK